MLFRFRRCTLQQLLLPGETLSGSNSTPRDVTPPLASGDVHAAALSSLQVHPNFSLLFSPSSLFCPSPSGPSYNADISDFRSMTTLVLRWAAFTAAKTWTNWATTPPSAVQASGPSVVEAQSVLFLCRMYSNQLARGLR